MSGNLCICLDVLYRRMVIHYQLPASVDTYIHRCGRTARGAGQEGLAVALVAPEEAQRWNALIKALARSNEQRQQQHQQNGEKESEKKDEGDKKDSDAPVGPPAFPIDATIMPQVRVWKHGIGYLCLCTVVFICNGSDCDAACMCS